MTKKFSAAEASTDASNVVPLRPSKAAKLRSEAKWGTEVMAIGFCILPSLLFRAQNRLGLKSTHLAVILQLADFWWHDDNLPYPKKQTIAERIGLKEKQVQRLVRDLQQRGYVKRIVRKTPHGQTSNFYDLSGLVKKLQELAPEFREAAAAKRKVERRGGLRAKTA
jgi:predicted transcriptional regulator